MLRSKSFQKFTEVVGQVNFQNLIIDIGGDASGRVAKQWPSVRAGRIRIPSALQD